MEQLTALTPLDGRYKKSTEELRNIFSEFGLIKMRVFVELQWFKFLNLELKLFTLPQGKLDQIEEINAGYNLEDARRIKDIEEKTNHDVKAVEYFIKERFKEIGLEGYVEWVHFSCTSEDINNASYALMLKDGRQCILKYTKELLDVLENKANNYKSIPMMGRTHGQPATPTTVGKEFVNFAWRVKREMNHIQLCDIQAKLNGATGNFNAHLAAFPEIDWHKASHKFLEEYLKVIPLSFTTQINPYSYIAELMHCLIRLASILIDLDRDMWGYISLGYFKQKLKDGEIGSSTMPHKVNPIDFENSEGNLGLAIALMEHLSVKLLNSRFQRDLTDSTVMRNLGPVFGYVVLGLKSAIKGLGKIEVNEQCLADDLNNNWELLAEPVQTVMRTFGEHNPYEKLKALTRGKKITAQILSEFIDSLENVPEDVRKRIKALTPSNYIGMADKLVDAYFKENK